MGESACSVNEIYMDSTGNNYSLIYAFFIFFKSILLNRFWFLELKALWPSLSKILNLYTFAFNVAKTKGIVFKDILYIAISHLNYSQSGNTSAFPPTTNSQKIADLGLGLNFHSFRIKHYRDDQDCLNVSGLSSQRGKKNQKAVQNFFCLRKWVSKPKA